MEIEYTKTQFPYFKLTLHFLWELIGIIETKHLTENLAANDFPRLCVGCNQKENGAM